MATELQIGLKWRLVGGFAAFGWMPFKRTGWTVDMPTDNE